MRCGFLALSLSGSALCSLFSLLASAEASVPGGKFAALTRSGGMAYGCFTPKKGAPKLAEMTLVKSSGKSRSILKTFSPTQIGSEILRLEKAISRASGAEKSRLKRRKAALVSLRKLSTHCLGSLGANPPSSTLPAPEPGLGGENIADECSDGVDNDGDGLVDMEDDGSTYGAAFGCLGPNHQESAEPRNGYTLFTPDEDSQFVFVSDSQGNDVFDGTLPSPLPGTQHGPKKTLADAARLMTARRGHADWMLLDSCDDFVNQYIGGFYGAPDGSRYGGDFSGNSQTGGAMLFGPYGTCDRRPRILSGTGNYMPLYLNDHDSHVVVTGLEFVSSLKDPEAANFVPNTYSQGLNILRASHDVLIEDNVFRYFDGPLSVNSVLNEACPQILNGTGECDPESLVRNVTIRRNVIVDSYSTVTHSQGIYSEGVLGLVIEENVFDHNGWSEHPRLNGAADATIFNHNMYLAKSFMNDTVVRGNIVANGSATGVQLRVGGVVENNLVLRNPLGITIGHAQNPPNMVSSALVKDNVVMDSRNIGAEPRGFGIGVGRGAGLLVDDNIVAHQRRGTSNIQGITVGDPDGMVINAMLRRNKIYDWSDNGAGGGVAISVQGPLNGLFLSANEVTQVQGGKIAEIRSDTSLISERNAFFTFGSLNGALQFDPLSWFRIGTAEMSALNFFRAMGDRSSQAVGRSYVDPLRTVETYMLSQGLPATYDAFMLEARHLSRAHYREAFTANAVNSYIRAGFVAQ